MRTLYGMQQSPWTEKARWALDHHAIEYAYHEHVPLIGEVLLRAKVKNKKKPANGKPPSVPLLVDADETATSSFEIARYADRLGRGASLFPRSHMDAIERWNDVSDRMIGVGRVRVLSSLTTRRAAQKEALPSFMPGFVRGVLAPSSAMAARFIQSKYGVPTDVAVETDKHLRPALEDVRAALAGGKYLAGGSLTYADIAVAAGLRAVKPEARAAIGPETRASWTDDALAREFEDLLMWRDALYENHR